MISRRYKTKRKMPSIPSQGSTVHGKESILQKKGGTRFRRNHRGTAMKIEKKESCFRRTVIVRTGKYADGVPLQLVPTSANGGGFV